MKGEAAGNEIITFIFTLTSTKEVLTKENNEVVGLIHKRKTRISLLFKTSKLQLVNTSKQVLLEVQFQGLN